MSIGLGTKTSPIEPEEGKPVKPLTPDDEGYVEEVYRRTQTPVRRHCTHLTGSPPDGEDLCHDSYVDFMVGRVQKQGRIEQERELPYLKTTATNRRRKNYRKKRVNTTTDDVEAVDDEAYRKFRASLREHAHVETLREFLPIARKRLNDQEFRAIELRYGQNLDYDSIAMEMGIPEESVRCLVLWTMPKVRYWAKQFLKRNGG